jgi:hypothetical protein
VVHTRHTPAALTETIVYSPNAVIAEVRTSLNTSDFRQMTSKIKSGKIAQHGMLWEFSTNSVQLRERKNRFLVPKRHWMKHLDFLSFLLESKQSI